MLAVDYTQVWTALFVAIPSTIGALAAWRAARHAKQVNDSVNHRHESEPRMLDYVRRIDAAVTIAATKADENNVLLLKHVGWHVENPPITPEEVRAIAAEEAVATFSAAAS
jgi:hypothetical protein